MKLTEEAEKLQRTLGQVDLMLDTSRRGKTLLVELSLVRLGPLKVKMYQELGHKLPHLHIDYGREVHSATYSIKPATRLAGTLKNAYDRSVIEWIKENDEKLLELWSAFQAGEYPSELIACLSGDA